VRAFSHITGGGLAANIMRVLPDDVSARVERSSWELPAVFTVLSRLGAVARPDMEQALNMGVGMAAIVSAADGSAAINILNEHGIGAWVAGEVGAAGVYGSAGSVTLEGTYG